ncbi:unnamed protein product [Ceutorhynchus assimilis]|uniref:Cilia- and flagella-associated protein 263 n=1 Tax=Ceutorhynchus assimilis TaxID=467358 RepID=A0A9N9QLL9_9CUCU|nr:unnamed protein product [Ceutorhynchus assimilis]
MDEPTPSQEQVENEKEEAKSQTLVVEEQKATEEEVKEKPIEEIQVEDAGDLEQALEVREIQDEEVLFQEGNLNASETAILKEPKDLLETSMTMLAEDELDKIDSGTSQAHPLDELTDQQLIELVEEMETENRHLYLENILFESFLKEHDPSSLDGFEEIINFLLRKPSTSPTRVSTGVSLDRDRGSGSKEKYRLDSYTSITSIAEGKGPKINLSQKTEMLLRAMEESHIALESFLKKCHATKRNLKAELEEFSIREAEIKEATEIFEYSVVTQGIDKLTQRIPAEKFIRYMEEWLKSAQLQIEKLRLKIATLKVQYKKVSQQLIQRQELGENVHAVDFDQLEIENKHFLERINQKNVHLVELKKMNGKANLVLSNHKKFLQKQQDDCNKLKIQIREKNKLIERTEKECEAAERELQLEMDKYDHCRRLKNEYTVPDVMQYVRLKDQLFDIKKNIKIWTRRNKIQEIALSTCIRELKGLMGMKEIDPKWFEEIESVEGSTSDD